MVSNYIPLIHRNTLQYFLLCGLFSTLQAINSNTIKTSTGIFLGFGALVAYSLFAKQSASGTLQFFPRSISPSMYFDGVNPVITINIGVQNTSNEHLQLRALAGDVYLNNYRVGNASEFDGITIMPTSEAQLSLKIRMNVLGIVNDLMRAITSGYTSMILEFDGYANVDGYQFPLQLNFKTGA